MTRLLRAIGARCARRPLLVIAVWVVVAGVTTLLSLTVGGTYSQRSTLPGTEVQAADQLLAAHFPTAANESADVLVTAAQPDRTRAAVPVLVHRIGSLAHVLPGTTTVRWSGNGRTALLHVVYDRPRFVLGHHTLTALERVARSVPGVTGYVDGLLAHDASMPSGGVGEEVGIGVAVLVLLLAFGSVIASLMPIATAAVAIVTGLALVKLLAHIYTFNSTAPQLATMMGLGVGVDYALFIVTRHREGLRAGSTAEVAAASSTATAGSSVLWAGVTVVAAICGLAFAGIPVVTSLGFASAIVVACSVAAALTLLPALLSLTDRHIDRLHIPMPHVRHERTVFDPSTGNVKAVPAPVSIWSRWAHTIERRAWPFVVFPAVALLVLAIPVSGMRLGEPDASSASHDSTAYKGFVLMSQAFGVGANAPFTLVASRTGGWPADVGDRLRAAVSADPGVVSVTALVPSADQSIAVMTVQPSTGPQDSVTADLVDRLRRVVLPPAERATSTQVLVTGFVAGRYDVAQRILHRLPWFVGAVLGLSFLLLMLVFRSLLVPLKAVLLNLLSIAAALGVVVAVFTWGWLRQAVGVTEPVPMEDVVPMLMFAIVFGLSMDYEVFLLSRVREEWLLGGDSRGSVVRGLTSTARVISAAAAIMVCVFLAFTLSSDVVVKMIGLGLAVAVLLDATVIRLVLVPATMSLLGDLNWWLPGWLDRLLPHIDVEGAVPVTPLPVDQDTDAPMARPTP